MVIGVVVVVWLDDSQGSLEWIYHSDINGIPRGRRVVACYAFLPPLVKARFLHAV